MTCSQTALWCELEVPSTPPDTGERCQHRHLVVLNLCRDLPRTPRVEAAAFKGTFGNVCLLKYYFTTKKKCGAGKLLPHVWLHQGAARMGHGVPALSLPELKTSHSKKKPKP